MDRELFGGRLAVKAATLTRWALRYHADVETGRAAVGTWLEAFAATYPPDQAFGDALWLERHFDAWLVSIGRTTPAPASATAPARATPPVGRAVPDADQTQAMLRELLG